MKKFCHRGLCTTSKLSHIDYDSKLPKMVDISQKVATSRSAHARAIIILPSNISHEIAKLNLNSSEINTTKGPVFTTAIIAGTLGAKKTSELIPFCHPLSLEKCNFNISLSSVEKESNSQIQTTSSTSNIHINNNDVINDFMKVIIDCEVSTSNKTGVEMEALTGVTIASLTIYDMLKAMSHKIEIVSIKLIEKTGGKSDLN